MYNETSAQEAREENYFIPMTDLLVGILFIFIIIIMIIMLNIQDLESLTLDEQAKNAGLLNELKSLRAKNQHLNINIEDLRTLIEQLNLAMSTLNNENSDLQTRLTLERDAHSQDIANLQLQINTLLAQANTLRKEMLLKIQNRLKKAGYPTFVDAENGILRLADNVLFNSGEYELSESGKKVVNVLGDILEDILPEYSYEIDKKSGKLQCRKGACLEAIYVEGHTDKRPVQGNLKGGITSNLQLSAARANETFQTLLEHKKLNTFVNERGEKLLGVSGYGESRPVVKEGSSPDDLRPNRRIDLRFLMAAPKLRKDLNLLDTQPKSKI
ncbi:MAG: OmpA family protein [Desulfovibrionaceae bacterium]|nr:OmpA family protein [Desulfovibrionaceae bacterium]